MIRRYVLNMQEVLKKLEEYERKICYATPVMSFCLDYRAIFKGKSHNCCYSRKANLGELENISLEEELED